jgi:hypothetical protein
MNDDKRHGAPAPTLPEATTACYDLLAKLDGPTRTIVIQTILLWFPNEAPPIIARASATAAQERRPSFGTMEDMMGFGAHTPAPPQPPVEPTRFQVGKRAQGWLRRYAVPDEALERVFDIESDDKHVIATVSGNSKREATTNCYLLLGIQAFLRNDEPRFTEADAVALCKREGYYDNTNHAQTRTTFGNRIVGSKEAGYSLPTPGLEAAAQLIKALGA